MRKDIIGDGIGKCFICTRPIANGDCDKVNHDCSKCEYHKCKYCTYKDSCKKHC